MYNILHVNGVRNVNQRSVYMDIAEMMQMQTSSKRSSVNIRVT